MAKKTSHAPIRYRIALADPKSHFVEVEMHVPAGHASPLVVCMAAWTPGSYKVRDFSRHVHDVTASGARGAAMRVTKRDKQSWVIDAPESLGVVCRYRVYCNELGVRTSHIDDRHAHLNGASVFLYAEGAQHLPCELTVDAPRGWKLAATLPASKQGHLLAADYDTLVDSPLELGAFDEAHFKEKGVPHRVVVCGTGTTTAVDLVPDLQKIVRAGAEMFGGLPYKDYTFFVHLAAEYGGGLEHKASCSLICARDGFAPRERYLDFLFLAAHEHFHAWNVKRLRPEALGPFDYSKERYTRMLWVAEGFTSYYEKMLVRRAGLATGDEILAHFADKIRSHRETPGRLVESLSCASFDAWIKYYQPHEGTPNTSVSYYHKGQLVGLLLDLELRRRTKGKRSLDDLMRVLYARYSGDHGFPDGAIRAAAQELAGGSFERFFDDHVDGVAELDFEGALLPFGLALEPLVEDPPNSDLGLILERRADRLGIATVLAAGPGAKAGLDAKDELIAWNGVRIDKEKLERRLAAHRPGERIELTVFRGDLLRTFKVTLGRRGPKKLKLERKKSASKAAGRLFRGWLGEKL